MKDNFEMKLYESMKDFRSKNLTTQLSLSSDSEISEDCGKNFTITDKLLGSGSFGSVYLATDEYGKKIAVKCCDTDATGIPNILEASIMTSIIHPHLNKAIRIHCTKEKLYIIQELAKCDLSQKTRRDRGNYRPTIEELRKWCFQISQGLLALHSENIIHADIKASNVLLYNDGNVKLTDFTLATKKSNYTETFTHNACTCTHRPIECFLKKPWNESLDIWSLGCTFYEIAYGEYLFPYQGTLEPGGKIKDKEARLRLRNRSVNAILDWASRKNQFSDIPQFSIDFLQVKMSEELKRSEMKSFNKLLFLMLAIDPSKRPTILDVLKHPFFTGMKPVLYFSVKRPLNSITLEEHSRVSKQIQKITTDTNVQNLAFSLYRKCNNVINENYKTFTCVWIASKIILGFPPQKPEDMTISEILRTEIEVCHNLLFRLHSL